jgi:hypothetical protein
LLVPTYEVLDEFWTQYRRLTPSQRKKFRKARREFIDVFLEFEASGKSGIPHFPAHLGVRHMVNNRSILEFAWNDDGRCTWSYGTIKRPGKFHIIWRRIGSHVIYAAP